MCWRLGGRHVLGDTREGDGRRRGCADAKGKGEEEPWGPSHRRTDGLATDPISLIERLNPPSRGSPAPSSIGADLAKEMEGRRGRTHARPEPDADAARDRQRETGWRPRGRRDLSAAGGA